MSDRLETSLSYIPRILARQKMENPTPIATAERHAFPAAILFTDISGFTLLTETLAR